MTLAKKDGTPSNERPPARTLPAAVRKGEGAEVEELAVAESNGLGVVADGKFAVAAAGLASHGEVALESVEVDCFP